MEASKKGASKWGVTKAVVLKDVEVRRRHASEAKLTTAEVEEADRVWTLLTELNPEAGRNARVAKSLFVMAMGPSEPLPLALAPPPDPPRHFWVLLFGALDL